MSDYLFVYGTLLKGKENNYHIQECDLADYIKFDGSLYDTGLGFPAFFPDGSGNSTYGEVYRLPPNPDVLLSKLDILESTDSGLFKRSAVLTDNKKIFYYEGNSVNKSKLIGNGSWLRESSPAKGDHCSFAVNFENFHKKHYRKAGDDEICSNIYLPGNIPVLVTSPHSTTHKRYGRLKRYEFYTAALASILHSATGAHALYANTFSELDPNCYNESPFKDRIKDIITANDIRFVLDIHGTGEEKTSAIYPGMGKEGEFIKGNRKLIENFYKLAKIYNIEIGSEKVFPAVKQDTIAKFCYRMSGVTSMQLEINRKYRNPSTDPESFNVMTQYLIEFVNSCPKIL